MDRTTNPVPFQTVWFRTPQKYDRCIAVPEKGPVKGNFLYKNGEIHQHSSWQQEKGIFINNDLYVSLQHPNLGSQKLSRKSLETYCKSFDVMLPGLYELVLLQEALYEVNKSIKYDLQRPDLCFNNALEDCWFNEALNYPEDEQYSRRVVVIKSLSDSFIPSCEIFGNGDCVLAGNVGYIKSGNSYLRKDFMLFAACGDYNLFSLGDYAFMHRENKFTYLGHISEYGNDVLHTSTGVYQLLPDGVKRFHDCRCNSVKMDESGNLLLNYYEEEYGGGEQIYRCNHHYVYAKKNGLYVQVDAKYENIGCPTIGGQLYYW